MTQQPTAPCDPPPGAECNVVVTHGPLDHDRQTPRREVTTRYYKYKTSSCGCAGGPRSKVVGTYEFKLKTQLSGWDVFYDFQAARVGAKTPQFSLRYNHSGLIHTQVGPDDERFTWNLSDLDGRYHTLQSIDQLRKRFTGTRGWSYHNDFHSRLQPQNKQWTATDIDVRGMDWR